MNIEPPDWFKSPKTRYITSFSEMDNMNMDDSLSKSLSDSFINIILPIQAD